MLRSRFRAVPLMLTLAASALTAGCAGQGQSSPIRDAAVFAGIATNPPKAEPFVVAARKPDDHFIPVGITPPPHKLKTRTPEEVKKLQDEMDATLKKNEAAGAPPKP